MSIRKLTLPSYKEALDIEELHLSQENKNKIKQLIEEFSYLYALNAYNLPVDSKVLLYGATGCGKTATANAIAKRLNKKVITLNLGTFVSSKLGETAQNIDSIFASARLENAVLFIDEFDFIGKTRDYDQKDSAEMKRAVNVLLQQIDNLGQNILLICATNHISAIDTALLRRFQLKLEYHKPNKIQLDAYYKSLLSQYPKEFTSFQLVYNISYAEAKDYVMQKVKGNIISHEKQKKQLLFSYGTLQLDKVQLATYGRILKGTKDALVGYTLENLHIREQSVIQKSNQAYHPIATKTNNDEDNIQGKLFELTTEELFQTDLYEVEDYVRVSETLKSGTQAWVYVKK